MLNIHARTHNERVGNPLRQRPEPEGHYPIDPKRNRPKCKENGQFAK
jgi:hypothetical protein